MSTKLASETFTLHEDWLEKEILYLRFDQIARLEEFTVFVQVIEYQSRNRFPSVAVLSKRVIHQVAQEDRGLQVSLFADIVELICTVLNIT